MFRSKITLEECLKSVQHEDTAGASEVVVSEATVLAETFAYRKLMGPESNEKVRGVGAGVASNQLNAKRNCQSGTEPSDSSVPNSLQGVNKSCTTQVGKKHIGMSQPHNFVNHPDVQNTSMGENSNTSICLNQSNIARRLNFDQRQQLKRIRGASKGLSLTSIPSPLSRELMCSMN
ncbi:hypothetical protein Cgig2_031622 [Carnegiea gigantea]|uniref:Uncharacterized protein n=1 Tax=Carnegiea gigantea TaxID=171969 RepID=A0A9Q1QE04_9CARY|nr:hypothetical protein Cgig2_031622 [Carnegiea gigantea]